MIVYRLYHYVVDQVFRAAVEYRILFGFHPLVPILGVWSPSSSTINEYQIYFYFIDKLKEFIMGVVLTQHYFRVILQVPQLLPYHVDCGYILYFSMVYVRWDYQI